jgi:hypothetical protein
MVMKQRLLIMILLGCISQVTYAIYLGKNNNAKALPATASIPPMVSILDASDTNGVTKFTPSRIFNIGPVSWTFQHDCAATLIAQNSADNVSYLLTSAHCVTDEDDGVRTIDGSMNKRIVVGNSWCTMAANAVGQCEKKLAADDPAVYTVKQIVVHKGWFSSTPSGFLNDDFAIIIVNGLLKMNGHLITPMSVAYKQKTWDDSQPLFVAGWGTTSAHQLESYQHSGAPMLEPYQRPNVAAVSTFSTTHCRQKMKSLSQWLFPGRATTSTGIDMDSQICTGYLGTFPRPFITTSFCYGDSGGPLFEASNSAMSTWGANTDFTLVGNVSGSLGLCSPAYCDNQLSTPSKDASKAALTDQCYDNYHNAKQIEVPSVYGFPGAVLCASDALIDKNWLAAPSSWLPTPYKSLKPVSLKGLTQGSLKVVCR